MHSHSMVGAVLCLLQNSGHSLIICFIASFSDLAVFTSADNLRCGLDEHIVLLICCISLRSCRCEQLSNLVRQYSRSRMRSQIIFGSSFVRFHKAKDLVLGNSGSASIVFCLTICSCNFLSVLKRKEKVEASENAVSRMMAQQRMQSCQREYFGIVTSYLRLLLIRQSFSAALIDIIVSQVQIIKGNGERFLLKYDKQSMKQGLWLEQDTTSLGTWDDALDLFI